MATRLIDRYYAKALPKIWEECNSNQQKIKVISEEIFSFCKEPQIGKCETLLHLFLSCESIKEKFIKSKLYFGEIQASIFNCFISSFELYKANYSNKLKSRDLKILVLIEKIQKILHQKLYVGDPNPEQSVLTNSRLTSDFKGGVTSLYSNSPQPQNNDIKKFYERFLLILSNCYQEIKYDEKDRVNLAHLEKIKNSSNDFSDDITKIDLKNYILIIGALILEYKKLYSLDLGFSEENIKIINVGNDPVITSKFFIAEFNKFIEMYEKKSNNIFVGELKILRGLKSRLLTGLSLLKELYEIKKSQEDTAKTASQVGTYLTEQVNEIQKNKAIKEHENLSRKIENFNVNFSSLIMRLEKGCGFIFPGGYEDKFEGGHVIVYEIEKQANFLYRLRLINTGEGVNQQNSTAILNLVQGILQKPRKAQACSFSNLTLDEINKLSPEILNVKNIYKKSSEITNACKNQLNCDITYEPFDIQLQEYGTCAIYSIFQWLRIHLNHAHKKQRFPNLFEEFQIFLMQNAISFISDNRRDENQWKKNNQLLIKEIIISIDELLQHLPGKKKSHNEKITQGIIETSSTSSSSLIPRATESHISTSNSSSEETSITNQMSSPTSNLWSASEAGNLDLVKKIVNGWGWVFNKKQKINEGDLNGFSPLILAVQNNHFEIAEYLLQNDADLHIPDKNGYMSIHWAAIKGNIKMLQLLIEKGAGINSCGYQDRTPLHEAIIYGHNNVIEFLCNSSQIKFNIRDMKGNKPLYYAATQGNIQTVVLITLHPNWEKPTQESDTSSITQFLKIQNIDSNIRKYLQIII